MLKLTKTKTPSAELLKTLPQMCQENIHRIQEMHLHGLSMDYYFWHDREGVYKGATAALLEGDTISFAFVDGCAIAYLSTLSEERYPRAKLLRVTSDEKIPGWQIESVAFRPVGAFPEPPATYLGAYKEQPKYARFSTPQGEVAVMDIGVGLNVFMTDEPLDSTILDQIYRIAAYAQQQNRLFIVQAYSPQWAQFLEETGRFVSGTIASAKTIG